MTLVRPSVAEEAARPETIEELFGALESPLLAYALRLLGEREAAEVENGFRRYLDLREFR